MAKKNKIPGRKEIKVIDSKTGFESVIIEYDLDSMIKKHMGDTIEEPPEEFETKNVKKNNVIPLHK